MILNRLVIVMGLSMLTQCGKTIPHCQIPHSISPPAAPSPTSTESVTISNSCVGCVSTSGLRATCQHGRCTYACASTWELRNGSCEPTQVRPIFPPRLARVVSRTPEFRWFQPQDTHGAKLEICRDRSCRDIEETLTTEQDHVTPTRPLRPGIHFWRVYAQRGDSFVQHNISPIEFEAAGRAGNPSGISNTIIDYNEDGFQDSQPVQSGSQRIVGGLTPSLQPIVADNPSRQDTNQDGIADTEDDLQPHAHAGYIPSDCDTDYNSDGYIDCHPRSFLGYGRVWNSVRSEVLLNSAALVLFDTPHSQYFGSFDANADGYFDSANGGHLELNSQAGTTVFPVGSVLTHQQTLPIGDINGDGYIDFAVHHNHTSNIVLTTENTWHLRALTFSQTFAGEVYSANDINGDGYDDVIVVFNNAQSRHYAIHLGSPTGVRTTPIRQIPGLINGFQQLTSVGDLNNDGFADLHMRRERYTQFSSVESHCIMFGASNPNILNNCSPLH